MKKLISLVMCLCALFSFAVTGNAQNDVKILLDGNEVQSDVAPFIQNDRTMVPARAIFEAMGAQVTWDAENKTVLMVRQMDNQFTSVVLQIGLEYAFVNSESVALDAPAVIVNDRTFVPLRFITEAFNEKIEWDENTRTVIITTNDEK